MQCGHRSLAVGCAGGVCLWGLSFSEEAAAGGSGGARLAVTGAYLVRVLAHPPGAPVSSLSWCPFGGQLASASREHAAILVWESSSGHHEQLWFKSGGGCAAVSWAPAAGAYVCALGVDGPVRVWESMSWRWETLRLGSGAHAAALGHAHGALPSLLSGAFAPKPVGAASRTAAGRGAAASPAFSAAVWSADGGALLLLPRHGPLLRYVVLRQSPPLIQPIDGGAHMLPVGPLGYAVHHDSALGEPPHERPALTLRPVGERARAAAAQGWEVARAQIDELLRASAGLGAAPEVEHLPGSPSGCVAVVRFRDVRAREHFAALVGGGGGWGGGGGVGGSGGTAEAQASGRGGGMEGAPAEWECVRCTSVSHVRHAVWDGAAERMAVCTQEVRQHSRPARASCRLRPARARGCGLCCAAPRALPSSALPSYPTTVRARRARYRRS